MLLLHLPVHNKYQVFGTKYARPNKNPEAAMTPMTANDQPSPTLASINSQTGAKANWPTPVPAEAMPVARPRLAENQWSMMVTAGRYMMPNPAPTIPPVRT